MLTKIPKDASIVDMTHEEWTTVVAPKFDGTWNLHNALLNQSLDFFILASSIVTIVDQPGQGNYKAANTFLEAFCQYRHSLGLPASVLNICPIDGVGFVAENPIAKKKLKAQGLYFLREQEFLDFLELSIFNSHSSVTANDSKKSSASWKNVSQVVMGLKSELHLDDPKNRTNWRRDCRMGIYHNIRVTTAKEPLTNSNDLKSFLSRAVDDLDIFNEKSTVEYLAREIGQKILNFLLRPDELVDISLSLTQIGLDSLMSIELRRWWKQAFGLQISVFEIMAAGTIEELGRVAASSLREKLKGNDSESMAA